MQRVLISAREYAPKVISDPEKPEWARVALLENHIYLPPFLAELEQIPPNGMSLLRLSYDHRHQQWHSAGRLTPVLDLTANGSDRYCDPWIRQLQVRRQVIAFLLSRERRNHTLEQAEHFLKQVYLTQLYARTYGLIDDALPATKFLPQNYPCLTYPAEKNHYDYDLATQERIREITLSDQAAWEKNRSALWHQAWLRKLSRELRDLAPFLLEASEALRFFQRQRDFLACVMFGGYVSGLQKTMSVLLDPLRHAVVNSLKHAGGDEPPGEIIWDYSEPAMQITLS